MDIYQFAKDIADIVVENIPLEEQAIFERKHKKRSDRLRNVARAEMKIVPVGNNIYVYELGSENLEEKFPHYHILEDAYTIKKRDRGTKKSKGSQAEVSDLKKRDYGIEKVTYKKQANGSYRRYSYQEYRKNIRGKRKPKIKTEIVVDKKTGETKEINVSNSYVNKHYHYIENTLDIQLPILAQKYGLKMKRVQIGDEEMTGNLPILVD